MMDRMVKQPKEIAFLREGGALLARVLDDVAAAVAPGVTTMQLNEMADKGIRACGGTPAFLGYGGRPDGSKAFPCALCTSVNEEVVHTIPHHEKVLEDGDIIGLDIGMKYKGLFTDHAVTVPVGKVSKEAKKLTDVTKKSLYAGLKIIAPGKTLGDLGHAIQTVIEKAGFSVVRELVGHGVGYEVHEPPHVPNFGRKGKGLVLKEGMVLAIEPMANVGAPHVTFTDNWAVLTADASLSAHFEHTIVVTKNGCEILTQLS